MSALPDLLQLDEIGADRFRVRHPDSSPEGRDVVFGGQLLAQMIMAADRVAGSTKDPKSIHAIFARAGTYAQPIELQVESLQAGRTWASDTVTATQGERLLARSLVLLHADEPDLMRHAPEMPKVAGPDDSSTTEGLAFPGAELRMVDDPPDAPGGVPSMLFWHRYPDKVDSVAGNDAILSWGTNGFLIGLAMRPHRDKVDISQAHRTISTGVIAHTLNFHERIDVSQWLLVAQEATYAGRGRIHGRGLVYAEDGQLVATFSQDSMARGIEGELDPKRAM
jgi:acyl-CoA thioesterase II